MSDPELEFSYGGQAHLARPANPAALSDQDWADYLYMRAQPQGRARRALASRARLRALLQRAARHDDRPDTGHLSRRRTPAQARCSVSRFRTATGGLIDRARPLRFRFDGRALTGFVGDTLASALLANGIHLTGRSFKYHRPRGILGAGADEPNALITVRQGRGRYTPNLRATQIELYEGLDAISQNRWPSLRFDVGAVNRLISPFISAGFYYKTFMWPRRAWQKLYEPSHPRGRGAWQGAE